MRPRDEGPGAEEDGMSKRIKELADEMLVHGTAEALAVLVGRYSAEEILKAAEEEVGNGGAGAPGWGAKTGRTRRRAKMAKLKAKATRAADGSWIVWASEKRGEWIALGAVVSLVAARSVLLYLAA